MTEAPARDTAGQGFVVASFSRGMVLLEGAHQRLYRLSWGEEEGDDAQADDDDRRRAVPAGTYQVVSYRIMRRDDRGDEWFISVSGPRLRKLVVKAGGTQQLRLDPSISVRLTTVLKQGSLRIAFGLTGTPRGGLSIYHSGKRIPLRYRVVDPTGKPVAEGPLVYG